MSPRAERARLVVVSNRLPITVVSTRRRTRLERAPGGLVSALDPVLRENGGVWIGWPGGSLRDPSVLGSFGERAGFQLIPLSLSRRDLKRFYLGFSNTTLWPVLHSFPTRMEINRDDWSAYDTVNRRFAGLAQEVWQPGDLIWIHDYQLMRMASHLRRARPAARIAFFLHVPFPAFDIFRLLPWDRELLRGLLACDLVGFHCESYASNFIDATERLLGARVDRGARSIEHGERTVSVGAFPLGTDARRFAEWANAAPDPEPSTVTCVLGVDRLDYTKGLPEKIRAFERFLELHPEHHERVVLMQIAELSRDQLPEYQRVKREVDELVGKVNGRFATQTWTPIHYRHRGVSPTELAGIYRDADVALVTPLRDGMNLVAKEYVACQTREPGVLILSRLAGAAETMPEALLVNPYNTDAVAAAIHTALQMSLPERTERMSALRRREGVRDVHAWVDGFLARARAPIAPIRAPRPDDFGTWLGAAIDGKRVALFVDFDGTLAEIVSHPTRARLGAGMRGALRACMARSDTDVAIVSGRALADVRTLVGEPDVMIVGNHGLEIEGGRLAPFVHPDISLFRARIEKAAKLLEQLCGDGSWVEQKGATLTLHYRNAAPAEQKRMVQRARALARRHGLSPRDALFAVEIRPPTAWDKGSAVLHVLRSLHGPAWSESVEPIYAGDDETDEDAFRALQGLGVTFRVGGAERSTLAMHRLPNVAAVETLLRWVAER
jgi:trehalose 6-phosphate synthase/phosphatase